MIEFESIHCNIFESLLQNLERKVNNENNNQQTLTPIIYHNIIFSLRQ